MFTGLIEDLGTIVKLEKKGGGALLVVNHGAVLDDLKRGDSVAIDGVCLTITELGPPSFSVEASAETIRRTTLEAKKPNEKVNLERALRLSDRLGGHLVTGHVDGVAVVESIDVQAEYTFFAFSVPASLGALLVPKGSVAVDGISGCGAISDQFGCSIKNPAVGSTCTYTDPMTQKIYDSYMDFRRKAISWGEIAEQGYYNARTLPFDYGG